MGIDLSVEGLCVRYGDRTALHEVTFGVPAGQRVALVGPNGSGKTTLLRALAGLRAPDRGLVRPVSGLDRRDIARSIAFLPQEEHWEFPFTVEEVVGCGRFAWSESLFRESEADRAAVSRALSAVALDDLRTRRITELSGGERRRVLLGRALAQEAPALLLDEPTTALDLRHRQAVVRALAVMEGTLVFSTHDLDAAAAVGERLLLLSGGRVLADGTPEEVLTRERIAEAFGVSARIVREEGRVRVIALD